MRKYIVVGVGGSGGATVRFIMDQLRADLRARGVDQLPHAWQFLQIDVNPRPDSSPELGSIRDLGGTYVSVSSASNTFSVVRQQVESRLQSKGHLEALLGWAPEPRSDANGVSVSEGAGQFRAVGRMLTLARLNQIQDSLNAAWQTLQQPTAWGDVPLQLSDQGPYDGASVVPIVIGSMAGGSGASMFLDVCRVLGRVRGLQADKTGVFLFTPDVFHALDKSRRVGIDGNAMATLGELFAAQSRAAGDIDDSLLTAMGLPPQDAGQIPFGRVLPVGASIGGDGAKFGENPYDVFRGLGRAIAATMISERATKDYMQVVIENPTPPPFVEKVLGWGANAAEIGWGSFGYSSLSLGRDRYGEYVAQRLARVAVDRLVDGYKQPESPLAPEDQLVRAVEGQRDVVLSRLDLPVAGTKAASWAKNAIGRLPRQLASEALASVLPVLEQITAGPKGGDYLSAAQQRIAGDQAAAGRVLAQGVYAWSEEFATKLEADVRLETVRMFSDPRQGLPFARRMLDEVAKRCRELSEECANARGPAARPLEFGDDARAAAKADNSPNYRESALQELQRGVEADVPRRVAPLLAGILRSVADDVVPAMVRALSAAQLDLQNAMDRQEGQRPQAGLAQLHTELYGEWPAGEVVPPRFNHAHNEVLLTTADNFPATFRAHVETADPTRAFHDATNEMVEQIVRGEWEDQGAAQSSFEVMVTRVGWRAQVLHRDASSDEPTPASAPVYAVLVSPSDVLGRATAFAARRDHKFAMFTNQSFDGYLNEPGLADSERQHRLAGFRAKFDEAVHKAAPLVGVDASLVERIHGETVKVTPELTFSEVPVAPASPAADALLDVIKPVYGPTDPSVERLEQAFTTQSTANRIAIYSTYPKFSPLVFSSFLDQLKERWASVRQLEQGDLWRWKRTRPLPAALAMSPAEQAAMIKGWYLGRILGLVTHPAQPADPGPVQVFDTTRRREMLPFPNEFLTLRSSFLSARSWLPGVLEGHSLAIARSSGDVNFGALQPYRALREIFDSGMEPVASVDARTHGEELLTEWIRTGAWMTGHPSEINLINSAGDSPEERAAAASAWLESVQRWYEKTYLADLSGPGVLSVPRFDIASLDQVREGHLDGELALVIREALVELQTTVRRALERSNPVRGSSDEPQF